ncbi:MAG: hypothetical protein RMX68_031545, partial [Aulosira sp. ZfuVER01]|nr:hypothetical protein [Aulosira sp. ZfuVER01]MDZ8056008.1 hypothetical protein [Aulosira sp. ZfuCHP01]
MSKQRSHQRNFFANLASSMMKVPNQFREIFRYWSMLLKETLAFVVACAVLVAVISLKSPTLLLCLIMGSLITITTQRIGQQFNLPKRKLIPLQIIAVATL